MALKPGTQLGPYEIRALLGAGGMGEVYQGWDTRLDRFVAIKILPAHLAERPDLRERFEREAKATANLKHPNICVLYDVGRQVLEAEDAKEAEEINEAKERQAQRPAGLPRAESSGGRRTVHFLVMEYLEGETLSARLKRGPLPLEQVLQYAAEISDALDKAHRQGYTHRDIKPGNIMLVPSTTLPSTPLRTGAQSTSGSKTQTKLLDFGLAKFKQEVVKATLPAAEMPTVPGTLTEHGTLLGTLHYMAPEQVESKDVDGRADLFAFGAVVYEMATGKKAFDGETQASVIAKILEVEPPPLSSLDPPGQLSPPALDRVVKKCLRKDREDRWQSARDVTDELKWIKEGGAQAGMATGAEPKPGAKGLRRTMPWAAAVLASTLIAGLGVWNLKPTTTPPPQAPAHLAIALPPGDRLATREYLPLALSPDGSHLVYVAIHSGVQQLFLRAMDSREAKPLPGTGGAESPFFSPDGQWIGFFAGGKLKKVPIAGGAPQTLCDSSGNGGGSWGPDNTIVFTPSGSAGLWRVSAAGGTPQVLTTLDHAQGEFSHRWPQFLPGGKALLFTDRTGPGWDEDHIAVLRFDTGEHRIVLRGGHTGRFVPTGHLVYYRAGTLLAAPFDLARLEVTSSAPVTIAEGVTESTGITGAEYSISATGSLAYVPASPRQLERRLVWVDRKGEDEPLPAPTRPYDAPALSPDGRQVAVSIISDTGELWIYDLARGALTRLSSGTGSGRYPLWTPDGKRITYRGFREGFRNVFWRAADGAGAEERLTSGENQQAAVSWSPDGKLLAFTDESPTTALDIWILRVEGERKPLPFIRTPFSEEGAAFSPDGRWLAYSSNEPGRTEVYVQPFPGPGGKHLISTEGGGGPRWARNGRELFYSNGNKMMVVDIQTEPTFTAGKPRLLFEGQYGGWDVAPDGQRFLMIQSVEPEQPATQINVVLNWFEELKRKVPTR